MKLNYESLKKRYDKHDFKNNNKSYYYWGLGLSYFGNVLSIFFAYFFMFPFLKNMLDVHVGTAISSVISFIISIVLLAAFEAIKRKSLLNISKIYFINNKKLLKKDLAEFGLACLLIILTFYYSSNGFVKMVDSRDAVNVEIDKTVALNIDSLKNVEYNKISYYETNIQKLESTNNELRNKLLNAKDRNRNDFQNIIDKNVELIKDYNLKVDNATNKLDNKSQLLIDSANDKKDDKNNKVIWDIIFAFIMSIFIEGVIIGGIFYCEKYMYKVFTDEKNKSGEYYDKKSKYKILLKYVYDDECKIGDPVIGLQRFKDILTDRKIDNVNNLLKSFYNDMDVLKIFELKGKRKFIKVDHETACNLVDQMDTKILILDELK